MKNLRKNQGITLIALVITIIVLLILAGVSLSLVAGSDGILSKTDHAVEETQKEAYKEELELIAVETLMDLSESETGQKYLEAYKENLIPKLDENANSIFAQSTIITDTETLIQVKTKEGYIFDIADKEISYMGKEDVGHHWNDWENIKEPTCTEEGINRRSCKDEKCEEVETKTIRALGHQEKEQWDYSENGHFKCCIRCGMQIGELESHNGANPCGVCGYEGNFTISYNLYKMTSSNTNVSISRGASYKTTLTPVNSLAYKRPETIQIYMGGKMITSGYTYNNVSGELEITNITGNIVMTAQAENYEENISFTNPMEVTIDEEIKANLTQSYQIRVFKFVPTETATYKFYSNDPYAANGTTDPFAYLIQPTENLTVDKLDEIALKYAQNGDETVWNGAFLVEHDDNVQGQEKNFTITYNCTAETVYYLVVRTWKPTEIQSFTNIYIKKQ